MGGTCICHAISKIEGGVGEMVGSGGGGGLRCSTPVGRHLTTTHKSTSHPPVTRRLASILYLGIPCALVKIMELDLRIGKKHAHMCCQWAISGAITCMRLASTPLSWSLRLHMLLPAVLSVSHATGHSRQPRHAEWGHGGHSDDVRRGKELQALSDDISHK